MLCFDPTPSGPVISAVRKADGAIVARDPCCATGNPGDASLRSISHEITSGLVAPTNGR
jgi:hypothetical protein